ncbi:MULTISPECIES: hypothetical protein [Streptomyces]|uniref:Uncharacterized protein n=1 Tax=Streptomyces morookaense TaxID=1970 RepID=A0A7Y7E9I7_STRMO|nr:MULTISPECIES: hypothetical protein [Streptomyces]MCC2279754.1 hypothetical protein [Streptomyces sp. ET3-23]NVK81120.1 hypothetical protein [Streptomyces morookaense]GHF48734.1 hypothetical protein GCM10010359_58730 [Streptomyces morookaense]
MDLSRTARLAARAVSARTARIAVVATAVILPAAALAATPAHAVTDCTVNGVHRSGRLIEGTPGDDTIVCSRVEPGTVVDAKGGNDTITVTGEMDGDIRAGGGEDAVTVTRSGRVGEGGSVDGQGGHDRIDIDGIVDGRIRGGQGGGDTIHLTRHSKMTGHAGITGVRETDTIVADAGCDIARAVRDDTEGVADAVKAACMA